MYFSVLVSCSVFVFQIFRYLRIKNIYKGGSLSYVQGNPLPMINHIIENKSLDIGQQYKTHLVDDLDGHSVWIKDVEYVDTKGEKKKCKSFWF